MSDRELPVRYKDPNSHEDFSTDWTNYLAPTNDTLEYLAVEVSPVVTGGVSVAAPSAPGGIQASGIAAGAKSAYAWLRGGIVGKSYTVTFKIRTAQGRSDEQSMKIVIAQR